MATWIKLRVDEMQWAKFDGETAKNLGLMSGVIRAIVRKAIQEPKWIKSDEKMWTFNSMPPIYVYRCLNISALKFQQLEQLCYRQSEIDRTVMF